MHLSLKILTELRAVGDLLVPEPQLRTDLRLGVTPAPTGAEVSQALNTIEARGWAISQRDNLTSEIRWRITSSGLAELSARGL